MAYKAIDIANKLLLAAARSSDIEGQGELMSNMKLQKMLYYQQGFHLAFFGEPLFDDPIEAWMYGPVVPSVYEHFKKYGSQGIPPETEEDIALKPEEQALFDEVYNVYAAYSAVGLMNLTHSESPWASTEPGFGNEIELGNMKEFFLTRING